MARPTKHLHDWGMISHTEGKEKILVMCMKPLTCVETQVWDPSTNRVKLGERKYRNQTEEEWRSFIHTIPELCCATE